ncbi:MauE/DoxX family redox-associated membrane protein [Chloroflexota bacterium]
MEIKESTYTRYISLFIRLLVGSIFIVSSISKLPLQSKFIEVVQSYQLLPDLMATAYGFALPWVELLIGCYLFLGILIKPGAIVTILLGISFMVANISAIMGNEYYCPDCFGEIFPLTVFQAISIDIFIIIAAVFLILVTGKKEILSFDSWFAYKFSNTR